MNGPEHYREAERLLSMIPEAQQTAARKNTSGEALVAVTSQVTAEAQVHATLALAAATVATRAFGPQEAWGGHAIEAGPEWQQVTA